MLYVLEVLEYLQLRMASLIIWTVMFVVFGLFIFYYFLEWNSKRELKKLRRNYNEDSDKSRPGSITGSTGGCREAIVGNDAGERIIEASVNTTTVSTDEPDTFKDKPKSGKDDKGVEE
jgi:hypothetical protein